MTLLTSRCKIASHADLRAIHGGLRTRAIIFVNFFGKIDTYNHDTSLSFAFAST